MTFRDTSAFTTLDNANMGTREDFRKWWKESGIEFASIFETGAAEKGWNARQPEIDALKAENERLRKDAERYRWLKNNCFDYEEPAGNLFYASSDLTQLPDSLDTSIDREIKDFSTQPKEE